MLINAYLLLLLYAYRCKYIMLYDDATSITIIIKNANYNKISDNLKIILIN